ncbi:amidohydrolase family protein [Lentzea sp. PSKA42]|uniref:Amidohydrolase family protein n=1 Tax=Lentzea indica TaxID=2604800 RepID=A0ABX1FJQ8_9PSEU|nr:amidohydrolase family protein [Lentzea indica]NKE58822.1 amidohydrolase family protein [Lentzea indica]
MSDLTSGVGRRDVLRAGAAMVAAGTAAAVVPAGRAAAASGQRVLALTGVTVVDATGRPPGRDMTVLVREEHIVAVGRRGAVQVPAGAKTLDLPGKFVIPGLWDAHVHSIPSERISLPLYLVNGITSVREMSGSALLHEWRDRVGRGELLGPRSVIAGRIVDGAPTIGDPAAFVEVATEAQAREAVRQAKRDGADFVKVYSRLSADLHRAIAEEACRQRIPFAGHCPDAVPLGTASAAGQYSIEHLYSTWYDTSAQEEELRARIAGLTIGRSDYVAWMHETHRLEWDAARSYSPRKAAAVFATLARNRTRIVPTLVVYRVLDRPDEVALDDERLKYVPVAVVEGWRWALENIVKAGWTPEETAQRHALLDQRLAFVGELARAGVPVVAGTDAGDMPFVIPGFSLHDELASLVRAGLSPLRALQAATIEPARMLGLDDRLGTVSPGKLADLVVLDADPLADIHNTTRVHTVLTRGRVISPEQRTHMLADIAAAAAEPATS